METTSINAAEFSRMFLAAAKFLEAKKDIINELNVFPVPDGDTGTNMTMTIMSAANEVAALKDPDMMTLCKAMSSGSLRGARGNSGVILSQLFRGFTKIAKTHDELTVEILNECCQRAVETAYKAVMKPKEGTILTVAKAVADKSAEIAPDTDDLVKYYEEVLKAAEETLARTPDMLPVLKQAGVVDSGGQGLVEVLRGGYAMLNGEDIDITFGNEPEAAPEKEMPKYLYRVSFVVKSTENLTNKDVMDYKVYLEAIGEDINVEAKNEMMTAIIMTNEPGRVIQKASGIGTLSQVSIINIVDDDVPADVIPKKEEPAQSEESGEKHEKDMGFVAVSIGDGMNEIFKELGADYIIEGGQTMNPSTDDILNAVAKVSAKTVFILPNNKNIILAADQAVKMEKDKKLIVIPTKTLPQGITALINFMPESGVEDNETAMKDSLSTVKSGEVTYAVRDTVIDDKEISEGDYMGIGDDGILSVDKDLTEVMLSMLDQMLDEASSLISLYYGQDVKKGDAKKMQKAVAKKYPKMEIELAEGGQPVYYYVTSVE